MTAPYDLDRTLGEFFGAEAAAPPPPEPLARVLESTRTMRPRHLVIAWASSAWVGPGGTSVAWGAVASRRPGLVVAILTLLVMALVGSALVAGNRLITPRTPSQTHLGRFTSAPDLSIPMAQPAVVALLDGRVLVVGQAGNLGDTTTRGLLYDPATGVSEATGPLVSSDSLGIDSAVLLKDGRVLLIGSDGSAVGSSTVQVFDPGTRQFRPVGPMITPRRTPTAAVLRDGLVLFAGGFATEDVDLTTSSAELFDPVTLTFSPTGSMVSPRALHSMAVLPDGRVFVSPGLNRSTVEIYDPATGTFSAAGTASLIGYTTAISVPDGRVALVARRALSREASAEVWDPTTLAFSPRHDLPGQAESAALLDDGQILLIGGEPASWSGVYDPTTGVTTPIEPTRAWRPVATRLADGRVLVVGGMTRLENQADGTVTSGPGVPTVDIFQ